MLYEYYSMNIMNIMEYRMRNKFQNKASG